MTEIKGFLERLDGLIKGEGYKNLRQFSLASGITYGTLSGYYNRGSLPDAEMLLTIANFFGVTVDYLLTGRQPWEAKPDTERPAPRGILIEGKKVAEQSPRAEAIRMLAEAEEETVKRVRAILEIDRRALEERKRKVKKIPDNGNEAAG